MRNSKSLTTWIPSSLGCRYKQDKHGGVVLKTLILHVHSELAADGRHVSNMGLNMAHSCGSVYYRNREVQHVFTSPVQVTTETIVAMMVENRAFDQVCRHPAIEGMGSDDLLVLLCNDKFSDLIDGGVSVMEAFRASHDRDLQHILEDEAMLAVKKMFASMSYGELGVGVFHEPFITLAAHLCGLRDLESLEVLDGIVFEFRGENNIVAKRLLIN